MNTLPITIEPGVALSYLHTHNDIVNGTISIEVGHYVITLNTLVTQWPTILHSLENGSIVAVEKTDESIATQWHHATNTHHGKWIENRQLRFITGGDAQADISNLNAEHFLTATIGSQNNLAFDYPVQREYNFLFTNRKVRPHRRYLISRLKALGLLDHALWSSLESHDTWSHRDFNRTYTQDSVPIKLLEPGFDPEVRPDWLDGVIYPPQFEQTWFTLVSETVFEYPYSFRTEKIYKPILAGHPFIVCANAGFYRDLHNLGFKTFNHLIDESFDSIIEGQGRLDRMINTVEWLCNQDLLQFWKETAEIRLYNQHRAIELHNSQQMSFAQQLRDFMNA